MDKYYVYILLASDNKLYVGYSTNLKARYELHTKGYVKSTKHRRPLKLIHYEYFISRKDAKAREVYLKSGAGHKQIYSFMKNTLETKD